MTKPRILFVILLALLIVGLPHAQTFGTWGTTFQQNVTASAVALPNLPARAVCIKANVANGSTIYIGTSAVTTSTGYALEAGLSVCLPVSNVNQVYVIAGSTGSAVSGFTTVQ